MKPRHPALSVYSGRRFGLIDEWTCWFKKFVHPKSKKPTPHITLLESFRQHFLVPVMIDDFEELKNLTKVKLKNLDKCFYPQANVTKAQVIEYYIKLAPKILPVIQDRPCFNPLPQRRRRRQIRFFEKNAPEGTPSWVKTHTIYSPTSKRDVHYIVCNDLDTLIWLANLAALEIHMPFSTITDIDKPDMLFFDVDPEPPATLSDAAEAAILLKDKLLDLGLTPFVKTSVKKDFTWLSLLFPNTLLNKGGRLSTASALNSPKKVHSCF